MTPETLTWPVDLDTLLAPISDTRPAGESLRLDMYDQIREARRGDDPNLPQGVWQTELKRADWTRVESLCHNALATRSKDLQLAAWLLEAWLHLHGFAGAAPGLSLTAGLCERFWDTLYPEIDGADLDGRLAPIYWLNEKLSLLLRAIPITEPHARDVPPCTWTDWENGGGVPRPSVARDAEAEARFQASVAATPTAFFVGLLPALRDGQSALGSLNDCLAARCGAQSPSLATFGDALAAIRHLLSNFVSDRGVDDEAGVPADVGTSVGDVAVEQSSALEGAEADGAKKPALAEDTPIRGRADLYRQLEEIADYLLRVEPHSPAPYLVRRAVSWSRMPLGDLLPELVHDASDLRAIYSLLGINPEGGG